MDKPSAETTEFEITPFVGKRCRQKTKKVTSQGKSEGKATTNYIMTSKVKSQIHRILSSVLMLIKSEEELDGHMIHNLKPSKIRNLQERKRKKFNCSVVLDHKYHEVSVEDTTNTAADIFKAYEEEENKAQGDNIAIENIIPNASDNNYRHDKVMGIYISGNDDQRNVKVNAKEDKHGFKHNGNQTKEDKCTHPEMIKPSSLEPDPNPKLDSTELDSPIDRTSTEADSYTASNNTVDSQVVGKSSERSNEVSSRTEEPETEVPQISFDEVSTFDPVEEKQRLVMMVHENTDSRGEGEAESVSKKRGEAQKSPENGDAESLWKELLSMRHFCIKPEYVNVFMLSAARTTRTHPKALGDIPWSWLREEKWRLHTFSTYPHNTAKSAILLASEGFAYNGSGKDRDDSVICYFCFATKREWLPSDDIHSLHQAISPSCSMVTGMNCDNIPMMVPKNGVGLFTSLMNQYDKPRNGSHGRKGDEIESDSVPETQQESQARPVREPAPSNNRKPVQMANSTIVQPSTPRGQTAPRQTSSATVTTHQATNNNAPSSTVASGHSVARQPNQSEGPNRTQTQQGRSSNNLSHDSVQAVGQSSQLASSAVSSNSSSARPVAAASSTPQTQSSTQSSPRPPASSSAAPASGTSTSSSTSNTNQTSNTPAEQGSNSQTSQGSSRPATGTGRGPTYGDLGIITERPKRYEYAVRARRLETFEHWPRDHHLKKEDLSAAGFYYAGYGDCARCFYCGGGLRNWEDDDNVWVEHARWFPKCAFIRQQMGQAFVDTVQDLNKDHDQISYSMVTDKMGANAVSFQLDSNNVPLKRDPAVRTVIDMGYQEKDVLSAAAFVKDQNTILSADKLFERLESEGKVRSQRNEVADSQAVGGNPDPSKDKETMDTLKDQNSQLRQQTVCKICMDKEVAVVFLPCGHLVSCTDCAAAMKDCPVCRNHVKGIVRAFMS